MDDLLLFIVIGFVAQLIDGSLGMAYGVTSTSFLLGMGVSPAVASACVHIAEVFTTGISGISHWKLGNINWGIARKLILPGVAGGLAGAYLLTSVPGKLIKPYIAAYLLFMGLFVLYKVFRKQKTRVEKLKHFTPLALFGGFVDAVGGGGWGPVVSTTMLARGEEPREVVGSVNFSEFFVTLVQAIAFLALLQNLLWEPILGLLIGGALAAPLGAFVIRLIPARGIMTAVGVVIVFLSSRTIAMSLGLPFIF